MLSPASPAPSMLSQQTLSLDHQQFTQTLAKTENILIIQDLDGVCMGLVNDPLTRQISADYVLSSQSFGSHFYVLTNGEHLGRRGVNRIVEKSLATDAETLRDQQRYLPGLAAGGVQWQKRDGEGSHPGVSEAELSFLKTVPQKIENCLREFFALHPLPCPLNQQPGEQPGKQFETYLASSILDNIASPSANLNSVYPLFADDNETFVALQAAMRSHFESLLEQATEQGLENSFFIHYAPNLGRGSDGKEIVWFGSEGQSGTTDYQFMLRGAVKEAGVLALLNHYYFERTGSYPLGETFNARSAPRELVDLVALAKQSFDPAVMPMIVGVGDTVTSQVKNGEAKRGGSDRNFLQLIQDLNDTFHTSSFTVYVDSSGGELKNRQPLKLIDDDKTQKVKQGPGDPADPLRLNVAFPGGHTQYCQAFIAAAQERNRQSQNLHQYKRGDLR